LYNPILREEPAGRNRLPTRTKDTRSSFLRGSRKRDSNEEATALPVGDPGLFLPGSPGCRRRVGGRALHGETRRQPSQDREEAPCQRRQSQGSNRLDGNDLTPKQVLIIPGGNRQKNHREEHCKEKERHGCGGLYREEGRHPRRGVRKDGGARIGIRKTNGLGHRSSRQDSGSSWENPRPGPMRTTTISKSRVHRGRRAGCHWEDRDRPEAIAPSRFPGGRPGGARPVHQGCEILRRRTLQARRQTPCGGSTALPLRRRFTASSTLLCPERPGSSCSRGSESGATAWTRDLVFFQTRRNRIHVGVFLGGANFFISRRETGQGRSTASIRRISAPASSAGSV